MKKSYMIAMALVSIVLIWMASGMLIGDSRTTAENGAENGAERGAEEKGISDKKVFTVAAQLKSAEKVLLSLNAQAYVEPIRHVTIRPEVAGKVDQLQVEQGQFVKAGEVLVTLAMEDKQVRLAKEQALLNAKQQTLSRGKALAKENFQSKSMIEEALVEVKAAEAAVAKIKLEIANSAIKAPFDGIFEYSAVEVGSYVPVNAEIGRFVDKSTLKVIAAVAQQKINALVLNSPVQVQFATGEHRTGRIRFISPVADEKTRTFKVEIQVDNPDNALFAGTTAEVQIPIGHVQAHLVSPGLLSIDAEGKIGLKIVNQANKVEFFPVEIVQSEGAYIWVNGLPEQAKIITIGQGFVTAGLEVSVSIESTTTQPGPQANISKPKRSDHKPSSLVGVSSSVGVSQ